MATEIRPAVIPLISPDRHCRVSQDGHSGYVMESPRTDLTPRSAGGRRKRNSQDGHVGDVIDSPRTQSRNSLNEDVIEPPRTHSRNSQRDTMASPRQSVGGTFAGTTLRLRFDSEDLKKNKMFRRRSSADASGPHLLTLIPGAEMGEMGMRRSDLVYEACEDLDMFRSSEMSVSHLLPETIDMSDLPLPDDAAPLGNLDIGDIKRTVHIADGSGSHVFKGHYQGQKVIAKIQVESSAFNPVVQKEFQKECEILRRLSHPHIISFTGSGTVNSEEGDVMLQLPFLVVEYLLGSTLAYHLILRRSRGKRPFKYLRALELLKSFASALKYLHEEFNANYSIIHRDLKPDNIGFTAGGTLKLIDFGLATAVARGNNKTDTYKLTGNTGSRRYMAPEVACNQKYNEMVDIYSFGVISYELLTGCIPFRGMNRNEFDLRVVREGFRPSLKVDDVGRQVIMTDRVRDLVQSCWHADFTQRQRASGLLRIISKDLELERQRVEQMGICGALSDNLIVRRNAI